MDIDKLFKIPKLPLGGNKRKLPDNPTPEMLKKLKMDSEPVSFPNSFPAASDNKPPETRSKRATVEDDEDDTDGRQFAPGGDADYFAEEDEEGRFFGGGLTSEQKEILNIFEQAEGNEAEDEVQQLTITQLRRSLQGFERALNKNQDQRSKYPDDPSKFIDSEADLDSAIKALLPLSQSPSLAYPELVRSGTLTMAIGLLTHENVDIVIDVIELIYELTDEDTNIEYEEEDYEHNQEALKILVEGLVQNSVFELLVDNLSRLNEQEDADRQGVFHVLGIFENMIGFSPSLASDLLSKTKILPWLLNRIQSKIHDENRGYSAELLSILLQNSQSNKLLLGQNDGVEIILKVLAQFRRRDPVDADETEFMENVFDSLCSALSETTIKKLFLDAEGPDLMILMIKDKHESRSRSIKVLDYAMSGQNGAAICEAFIDALGLKPLFMAFMNKSSKRQKTNVEPASEDMGHILGIIASLFTHLPSDSPSRIRVLAKFVEGDYEKVDKLLELRDNARKRLKITDAEIAKERQEMIEKEGEEALADVDDTFISVQSHASRMLDRGNQSFQDIVQTLRVYHEHVDMDDTSSETEVMISQKEILQGLIAALDTSRPKE
ncbi:Catenin-beta-like protein [Pholiota molesta]|nr:Catenin-beta-like protein [Pholiota molesta]